MNMDHLKFLEPISQCLVKMLHEKEREYKGSWKKRGGVGAFFVAIRKADALEEIVRKNDYDVFSLLGVSGAASIEDQLEDLAGYCLLILAERAALRSYRPGTPEDGGHHANEAKAEPGSVTFIDPKIGLVSASGKVPNQSWFEVWSGVPRPGDKG